MSSMAYMARRASDIARRALEAIRPWCHNLRDAAIRPAMGYGVFAQTVRGSFVHELSLIGVERHSRAVFVTRDVF